MVCCGLYVYGLILVFLCFKQKTAYEMRISDWSSDVCSSDLAAGASRGSVKRNVAPCPGLPSAPTIPPWRSMMRLTDARPMPWPSNCSWLCRRWKGRNRSEEHTSELQSLMRIQYAVFCLKKKPKHPLPY